MKDNFLKLKNINYQVGIKKILDNISFSIKKGDIFSIIGPSGSGKTTILKTIAGLITPSSGKITIDDINVTNVFKKKRSC